MASPLLADLTGFPKTLIFAGGAETLLGDGLSLCTALVTAGASVEAHFPAGMQHVWPTLFPDLPESIDAMAAITQFIARSVTTMRFSYGVPMSCPLNPAFTTSPALAPRWRNRRRRPGSMPPT